MVKSSTDAAAVSIRAPRVGGDLGSHGLDSSYKSFNPRPPRGGRWAPI